jgi:hypothetical protein
MAMAKAPIGASVAKLATTSKTSCSYAQYRNGLLDQSNNLSAE